MSVKTYDPWSIIDQMRNDINRAVVARNGESSAVATADWTPSVDIKEEDKQFVLYADIPGVSPKDIEVHMENGMLTVRGERKTEATQEEDNYKRVERVYGSFYRRFSLPDTADAEKIAADSSNGVLKITIPKIEKVQPRRISVNVNG